MQCATAVLYDQRSRSLVTSAMVRCTAWRIARSASRLLTGAERWLGGAGAPQPVEEAPAPVNDLLGLLRPVHVVERRPDEEVEQAEGVGAHRVEVVLGRDQVALGLGHLGPVHADHALGQIVLERLAVDARRQADVDEGARVEAGVEQVEDGVLNASDVLVDGHELLRRDRGEGLLGVPRVA